MVARSNPVASSSESDETSNSRAERIQYWTRLFTILSVASIYVLIRERRKRSLAVASGREMGFTPAEIGAAVSLASSLAWLFILLPILRFDGNKNGRTSRRGVESAESGD